MNLAGYSVRKGKRSNWRVTGSRVPSGSQEPQPHGGNKDEKQTGHGTQKPVEANAPAYPEPYQEAICLRSISRLRLTLIAAQQTERVCLRARYRPSTLTYSCSVGSSSQVRMATLEGDGRKLPIRRGTTLGQNAARPAAQTPGGRKRGGRMSIAIGNAPRLRA